MPLETLLTAAQIAARVQELGNEITHDFPAGELLLICILKGASIFHADLARAVNRPAQLEFMGISSYGGEKTSSGQVRITKDLAHPIEGMHVLIVEDIVDSGITLDYLSRLLRQRHPLSLGIVTLLDKPQRRVRPVAVKYVGFSIPDRFVVGYGLDFNESYRNLPDVCILTDNPTEDAGQPSSTMS